MTTPRNLDASCSAGSQVSGDASPVAFRSSASWIVNFNNGNVNNNDHDNDACVRAVRVSAPAGEYQGAGDGRATFRALYIAWQAARRQKRPSANQARFEANWIDRLLNLEERLTAGTWSPAGSMCFVATRPKAREIHAPDFGDRVVHHWLVPQIERIYEPRFIADSYANRKGKGTHAAVRRVQTFVRQVHSGQGGGWYLQLDVHNFFNSVHRPTLYAMLKARMERHGVGLEAKHAVHALLRQAPGRAGVVYRSTASQRALVPTHKQMANAAAGCGLPIGNLSSQFFANVYLDALDQFVKHELRARRYARYVDDFVLVHRDRNVLAEWQARIEVFLRDRLRLRLKDDIRLRPLSAGVDFLGYVIYPTHTRVRRRVVTHLQDALRAWQSTHVTSAEIRATPEALNQLRNTVASYAGHLRHANSAQLLQRLALRFPWAQQAMTARRFDHRADGRTISIRRHA